ncbi:MAG: hypothetical protein ACI9KA_002202, partial [Parasphingorhabdus sp.]
RNHEGSDNMAPQPFADLEDNHLVIGMETKRMASLWENQLDNSGLIESILRLRNQFILRNNDEDKIGSLIGACGSISF